MLWVMRTGQKGQFFDKFMNNKRLYLPWDGYKFSLSDFSSAKEIRPLVEKEKGTENRTSVSNWSGQLYSFSHVMKAGELVLIPEAYSRGYALGEIIGDYEYDASDIDELYHSRPIKILTEHIPATIFSQSVRYSLGAYRTIFKVRQEEEILNAIKKWSKEADA